MLLYLLYRASGQFNQTTSVRVLRLYGAFPLDGCRPISYGRHLRARGLSEVGACGMGSLVHNLLLLRLLLWVARNDAAHSGCGGSGVWEIRD